MANCAAVDGTLRLRPRETRAGRSNRRGELDDYLTDYNSIIIVMDPKGRFAGVIAAHMAADRMTEKLRQLVVERFDRYGSQRKNFSPSHPAMVKYSMPLLTAGSTAAPWVVRPDIQIAEAYSERGGILAMSSFGCYCDALGVLVNWCVYN
jgi:hypothetical protein